MEGEISFFIPKYQAFDTPPRLRINALTTPPKYLNLKQTEPFLIATQFLVFEDIIYINPRGRRHIPDRWGGKFLHPQLPSI